MTRYAVQTEGLCRKLGNVQAVTDLAIHVPEGGVYGFLGPNGAGKTTTIRMLLGLIRPDSGEVRYWGERLKGHRRRIMRQVGALVEGPSAYPHLTGRENLEVTRRLIGATVAQRDRSLHLVRLADAAERQVKTYSQGMKQRLSLAAALMDEPRLLILDEPTTSLDPAGIREIRDMIVDLPTTTGATVLLSSHQLREVEQVATHIGIIQEGRLRFEGTLESLREAVAPELVLSVDNVAVAKEALVRGGWKVSRNGGDRIYLATSGVVEAAAINRHLVGLGLDVSHLALSHPTLEDVFMRLTGAERDIADPEMKPEEAIA